MDKHPYMKEAQEAANALSTSVNPITLQWESSQIVRNPENGIAKRVQIFKDGICIWDSKEKAPQTLKSLGL